MPALSQCCRCGHIHAYREGKLGECLQGGCDCSEFHLQSTFEYQDPGAHDSLEAGPLCPACGKYASEIPVLAQPHMSIVDSEGYRWHTRCVVDLLPSVRGFVMKAGLDLGRK